MTKYTQHCNAKKKRIIILPNLNSTEQRIRSKIEQVLVARNRIQTLYRPGKVIPFISYLTVPLSLWLTTFREPTFREVATWALPKRRLSNELRNSILMTCHYPYLGIASDWLKREGISFQPTRSTAEGAFLWENPNPDSCIQKRILRFFT